MIDSEIGQWNRKAPQTVEEIIAQGEAFLIPTTYYAFGYVMGVVFGDGSISTETNTIPHTRSDGTVRTHDSTVYRVRLQTVSGVFAKRFAEQWTILTGKPPTIQTTVRSKWSASSLVKNHRPTRLYMVQPRHTILGRYLKHIKYVEERGHERVLGWPQEVQQAFMHGMIDSEGYVGPRQTYVYNMNWALLETVGAILSRFDAKFTIQTGVPPSAHHLRTITSTGTGYDKFDVPKYVPVDRHWALGPNRDEEWKKYRHTSGRY